MAMAIGFMSCEPSLENTFNEIGEPEETFGVAENSYTLTKEDYKTLLLDPDGKFPEFFESKEEAENLVPTILEDLYANLDVKSLANVSFNLKEDVFPNNLVVSQSDYEEVFGAGTISISGLDEVSEILSYKKPQSKIGDFYNITYQSIGELIDYTLTNDDYTLVGNGNYNNFDIRVGKDEEDIAVRVEKIATILGENFPNQPVGQRYEVTYAFYNGSSGTDTIMLENTGDTYILIESSIPNYTLSGADYDLIVTGLSSTYAEATGSMDNYGNFERREANGAYWSDIMLEQAITIVLNNEYPAAVAGDKYQVTFSVYTGSAGTETYFYEKDASGDYFTSEGEINLITITGVVAYDSLEWVDPVTFTAEEYAIMQQTRFPNFSDEQVALKNIGIYLGTKYSYASEGDYLPVIYDFYNGANRQVFTVFQYENGSWVGKPIIYERSIQFGKEVSGWEPDNTIVYTLISPDDYDFIGGELLTTEGFESAADNLAFFHSFERRDNDTEYWSDEMLLKGFGILIDDKVNPTAEIGQKYFITITVWLGGLSTQSFSIIKDERDGVVGWYYQD
jgi:hypothetical protein